MMGKGKLTNEGTAARRRRRRLATPTLLTVATMAAGSLAACRDDVPIGKTPSDAGMASEAGGEAGDGPTGGGGKATFGGSGGGSGLVPSYGAVGGESGAGSPAGGQPGTGFPGEPLSSVEKLDLLLVVDNSAFMESKQALFKRSVARLLERLTDSVSDIHVGVISTSLGARGGQVCDNAEENDRAHLIPTVRSGLTSWSAMGFSKWDPDAAASPPGHDDVSAFVNEVTATLDAVGTTGCGYEAPLEAWYRFLIDPEPSETVAFMGEPQGVDTTVLAQRAAFLRPDSAVAVVVLSDENDCSFREGAQGWLTGLHDLNGQTFRMTRATSVCATDPSDRCCYSCAVAEPPPACVPDPVCNGVPKLSPQEDHPNLRCWDQKRRFGVDLLYPIQRYVDGLTSPQILTRNGVFATNPLFTPIDGESRRPQHVLFTAIVGVPWQDIATEDSLTGTGLELLTASELASEDRWSLITASEPYGSPVDPFMIESLEPRSGEHPLTGDAIQPPATPPPPLNPINGHERRPEALLQSACFFPRPEPIENCSNATVGCICRPADSDLENPECRGDSGFETTQYYDWAMPGLRQLEVLKRIGSSAVVGSICPKSQDDHPDAAYNPALDALGDRIGEIVE